MQIIINVPIKHAHHLYSLVRREYESNLVPVPGMQIQDSAWKEPRKIMTVTIDPMEGYYFLSVESDDDLKTKEQCEEHQKMYISHGWKSLKA